MCACHQVHFPKEKLPNLNLIFKYKPKDEGLYKCRVLYGTCLESITFIPYAPKDLRTLCIVHSDTIRYRYKYQNRKALEDLYEGRLHSDDILIVKDGLIKDLSYANIVLKKGNDWYTPQEPLLAGVERARLLDQGIISAKKIALKDLYSYDAWKPINAMRLFNDEYPRHVETIQ